MMKQIQKLSDAENYSAINLGKLSDVKDYVLELGPEIKIPGKVFGGQALATTGAEFSFQVFAPGQETGFLHTHKNHEELYFFLSGKGEFQVDGKVFRVNVKMRLLKCKLFVAAISRRRDEPVVLDYSTVGTSLCDVQRGATC